MKKFSSWKLTRPPTFGHELHYPFCETRTSPALAIIVARPPSCRSLLTTWPVFLYFVQKLPRWKHTLWSVDDERMPEPAPPIFGRSDQPIPTRGGSILSPPRYYSNLRRHTVISECMVWMQWHRNFRIQSFTVQVFGKKDQIDGISSHVLNISYLRLDFWKYSWFSLFVGKLPVGFWQLNQWNYVFRS